MVRIIGQQRQELAPRITKQWTIAALTGAMTRALDRVPGWLRILTAEQTAHRRGTETAIFGMD